MIKPKKKVGGSSAAPRVFWEHTGICTGTRALTKVYIGYHTARQSD